MDGKYFFQIKKRVYICKTILLIRRSVFDIENNLNN